jgi:hypothetical protein
MSVLFNFYHLSFVRPDIALCFPCFLFCPCKAILRNLHHLAPDDDNAYSAGVQKKAQDFTTFFDHLCSFQPEAYIVYVFKIIICSVGNVHHP